MGFEYVQKTKTINGKRYRACGKTEREAKKKLDAIVAEVLAHGARLESSTSVRDWSKEWLEVYIDPKDATAKSRRMYREKLDVYILPAVGSMRIGDVRDTHLQKIINGAASSKSNAMKVRLVIRAMFRQARISRLIPFDPAEDLIVPKAPAGKRRSVTDFERKHILSVAETHRGGLAVLLSLYCGLRPGELAALQWLHVDFGARRIHVCQALESGDSTNVKAPKTDAGDRFVPIPAPLLSRLEVVRGAPFDYVLQQPRGKRRHTETSLRGLWASFKDALDVHMGAKVERRHIVTHAYELDPMHESRDQWETLVMYCLRHTYGTDLQRAGVPINVAKYLMGHSDIAVTGNIYTDTTPDVIDAAEAAINALCTKNVQLDKNCPQKDGHFQGDSAVQSAVS